MRLQTWIVLGCSVLLGACTKDPSKRFTNYNFRVPRQWEGRITFKVGSHSTGASSVVEVPRSDMLTPGTQAELVFPTPCGPKMVSPASEVRS